MIQKKTNNQRDSLSGESVDRVADTTSARLRFDGYLLHWISQESETWSAFSGPPDESKKESDKETDSDPGGPIPQGKFAVEPSEIEEMDPEYQDDWGKFRVRCWPYRATTDRMRDCFRDLRTDLYIHGGSAIGTNGCIEINNDNDEKEFFNRLRRYGQRIEIEVKYTAERKSKYEEPRCPYSN